MIRPFRPFPPEHTNVLEVFGDIELTELAAALAVQHTALLVSRENHTTFPQSSPSVIRALDLRLEAVARMRKRLGR